MCNHFWAAAVGSAGRLFYGLALTFMVAALVSAADPHRASASEAPPGAASCTGCHPANPGVETPVPRLAGQVAATIVAAMQAFRNGKQPATVMDRIAKGFSDDEIKAIAVWFSVQR